MKKQMNQLSKSSLMKLNKSVLVKEFKRMQEVVEDPVEYTNVYRDFTKEKLVLSLLDLYDVERKFKANDEADEQLRRLEEGDPHDRVLGKGRRIKIEREINPFIYLVDRNNRKPKSKRCKIVLSQYELNADLEPVIGIGSPDEFYTYTFPEKLNKKSAKEFLQVMCPGAKWSLRHEDSLLHDFNEEYTELWIPRQLNNGLDGHSGKIELQIVVTKKDKYLLELRNTNGNFVFYKINQKDVLFLTEHFQIEVINQKD